MRCCSTRATNVCIPSLMIALYCAQVAVYEYALHTGDFGSVFPALWSNDDRSIRGDGGSPYNSLQFEAGLRYWNGSGNGLLHFPATGDTCGGTWACDPLVDWPAGTRDGYDCDKANSDDTVRSALGAMAYHGIAALARWLNQTPAATRYAAMEASVLASLLKLNLRVNATAGTASFVDGAVGAPASHTAVHSTLYAVSAGAADGVDVPTALGLVTYLRKHGVSPSSCMAGRWWVTAGHKLGLLVPDGADLAMEVLTSPSYPGWLDMLAQGATTTMEAWRPADKSNLDWAHPWCASPSFLIPGGVLGVAPLEPQWATFRVAPQPSGVRSISAYVPTPRGGVRVAYSGDWTRGTVANATLSLTVPARTGAYLCLAIPGTAADVATFANPASDALFYDGALVPMSGTTAMGRFVCVTGTATPGYHVLSRVVTMP